MFSASLLEEIRIAKSKIKPDCTKIEIVSKNLLFLYHACIASEQLLIDAALGPSTLVDYYKRHLEEEKGEIAILREDLHSAKIAVGDPDRYSMAMIGTQYYLIKHVHPCALLGYMAVQEADPTPLETVEILENLHGKNLFRFLRLHAIKDLEHRKEILNILDEIPAQEQKIISDSAANALTHYREAALSWEKIKDP
jgi:hypothetical protein